MQTTVHFQAFLELWYILYWCLHNFTFLLFDRDIAVDLNISALNFLFTNSFPFQNLHNLC